MLRALEAIPRADFVEATHAALTYHNVALPIPCGQVCPAPLDTARMLQGAELVPDMRVLEIGTGSGYATALLASLVQRVVSVERYRTLVQYAKHRLSSLEGANVSLQWADALDLPPLGVFDCLIVHGIIDPLPDGIWRHLVEGGAIVHGRWQASGRTQLLVRTSKGPDGGLHQVSLGRTRLQPLAAGLPSRM